MSDRCYRINGEEKPSITTIVHILDNPHLDRWKLKIAMDYIRQYLDFLKLDNADDVLAEAEVQHEAVLQQAANWGTVAHKAIEDILKGENDPYVLDEKMEEGVWKVAELLKENDCEIIAQEEVVYGNGCAGTVDLLCRIKEDIFLKKNQKTGKKYITIIDFKSSKSYYDTHKIQLAGYKSCTNTENNLANVLTQAERFGIIRLSKENGRVNCKDFSSEMDKWSKVFSALKEIYWLMKM